jgi:hypothetical protein
VVFIELLLPSGTDFLVSADADLAVLRDTVRVISMAKLRGMLNGGR